METKLQSQEAFVMEPEKREALDALVEENDANPNSLIEILHGVQEIFGYIPKEVQRLLARKLRIPTSQIYGVVTFYSYFSEVPRAQHEIIVCLGTACYVKGAQKLIDRLEEELDIKCTESTDDLKFSLSASRCIGACGLAPVMTISGEVYAKVKPEEIPEILKGYRE